jgi:PAS domain S-box-containing protein
MLKARLLIAEDELIVAEDMTACLAARGYEVVGVVSTGEAVIKEALSKGPDLILMDVRLKGARDGIEAATEIHRELDVPIIYVSAYAERDILERAKLTEPYGYVLKPFGERDLNKTVEMALYKHEMDQRIKKRSEELAQTVESLEREVARRQEVEKRLLEREARFSRYFHLPLVGMATLANDLTLSSVNDKLCKMLNMEQEELIGKRLGQITDPEDYDSERQYISQVFSGAAEAYTMEKTLIGLNGLRAPALTSVGSIRRPDGTVDHFVALMQDLSKQFTEKQERIRWSEEILKLLEAVNKGIDSPVSNLERFSGAIRELVHEALTLRRESGVADNDAIKRLELIVGAQIPECAEHMTAAGSEVERWTRLLWDYVSAKTSTPVMSSMDLNELINEVFSDMRQVLDRNRARAYVSNLGRIVGERPAMENLVRRIVRQILLLPRYEEDLEIRVSAELTEESSTISFVANADPSGLEISGERGRAGGIDLERVFARVWAERMGGTITVSQSPQKWAIIRCVTPIHPVSGLRTLFVDDNVATVTLISQRLRSLGHTVYPCFSAEEALEILDRSDLDIVIGDLGMPGMDGWELGKKIIDHCRINNKEKISYIVLTGWADYPDQEARMLESGVDEILQKPVEIEDLLRVMARVVRS